MIHPTVFQSNAWSAIAAHLYTELERLRLANDSPRDPVETTLIRGEIRFVKSLLALASPEKPIEASNHDPYDT